MIIEKFIIYSAKKILDNFKFLDVYDFHEDFSLEIKDEDSTDSTDNICNNYNLSKY